MSAFKRVGNLLTFRVFSFFTCPTVWCWAELSRTVAFFILLFYLVQTVAVFIHRSMVVGLPLFPFFLSFKVNLLLYQANGMLSRCIPVILSDDRRQSPNFLDSILSIRLLLLRQPCLHSFDNMVVSWNWIDWRLRCKMQDDAALPPTCSLTFIPRTIFSAATTIASVRLLIHVLGPLLSSLLHRSLWASTTWVLVPRSLPLCLFSKWKCVTEQKLLLRFGITAMVVLCRPTESQFNISKSLSWHSRRSA